MTTQRKPYVKRQCARVFFPNLDRFTYRCPALVPELRRSDAIYCSPTCKRAAIAQRKTRSEAA